MSKGSLIGELASSPDTFIFPKVPQMVPFTVRVANSGAV